LRVLLTGAGGLIGSAVLARLRAEGHEVVAIVRTRTTASARLPVNEKIVIDIARATRPNDWLPHLTGIEAVVNCAGVLQDSPTDSTTGVHIDGINALFAACEHSGVRRVVHVSAIGVDRAAPSAFSRSKLRGDEALMILNLDWVILRPSVVVGRAAYGGSALFRGLAALPILPVPGDTAPLQVVQLDELTRTVLFFLRPDAPSKVVVEVAGPRSMSMTEIVQTYRNWFGWPRAHVLPLPRALSRAIYQMGDAISLLGWRPPMRSTARREIARGAIGDATAWTRMTGIEPRDLTAVLAAEPASVQERWFAQLYFLKPVVFGVLAAFWIITGVISLGPGFNTGKGLMQQAGMANVASISVIVGALADIAIGLGIAFRRTARLTLYGALALSILYAIAGTILLPQLWAEPLGPMLKIVPIFVLHLVALAILDDR
jgi:uncharacterized protein YbjT (DUF2867 family)